jgi:hypothetical protein
VAAAAHLEPYIRTVEGAVSEAAGGRGRGTLCQASARAHSRYRVWGTGAGGTGIMTGGTGWCQPHYNKCFPYLGANHACYNRDGLIVGVVF